MLKGLLVLFLVCLFFGSVVAVSVPKTLSEDFLGCVVGVGKIGLLDRDSVEYNSRALVDGSLSECVEPEPVFDVQNFLLGNWGGVSLRLGSFDTGIVFVRFGGVWFGCLGEGLDSFVCVKCGGCS